MQYTEAELIAIEAYIAEMEEAMATYAEAFEAMAA